MSIGNMGDLGANLKTVYDKATVENLANTEAVTFSKLKRDSSPVLAGSNYVFGVEDGLNYGSVASINELESLPSYQATPVKNGSIARVRTAARVMLSGDVIESAKQGGTNAMFMNEVTRAYDNAIKAAAKLKNQEVFRDGKGTLAVVNGAVSASATIAYDGGIPTHLQPNMIVDIYNGSTLQAGNVKILSNDLVSSITVDRNVTVADNAVIKIQKAGDNAPTNGKDIIGLPLITDATTTYEGIDRTGGSAVQGWKGLTIDASGVSISDALLRKILAQATLWLGTKGKLKILSNEHQNLKYIATTLPQVQFNSNGGQMSNRDTGVAQLTWNGMAWDIDTDCGYGDLYFINYDEVKVKEETPFAFTGMNPVSGFDAKDDYAIWRGAVFCKNPKKGALRIKNLAFADVVF
jgi:hypothetical protein